MPSVPRLSARNARFQQWQALLGNRNKRQRAGEFLVQGVRPISLAARHGWRFRALIYDADRPLSQWARALLHDTAADQVPMAPGLLAELGEKDEGAPELVAVVAMPGDDLGRIEAGDGFLGVVLDRPASTGSLFALPVVRAPGHREVTGWVAAQRARGCPIVLAAADERGGRDVSGFDLTQPALLLIGNEGTGLSAAWRELSDVVVSIPMAGAASSLNAASAAAVLLYEASRQRLRIRKAPRINS